MSILALPYFYVRKIRIKLWIRKIQYKNGEQIIIWNMCIGIFTIGFLLTILFSTMCICAYFIHHFISKANISNKTRRLHHQLFNALFVQVKAYRYFLTHINFQTVMLIGTSYITVLGEFFVPLLGDSYGL